MSGRPTCLGNASKFPVNQFVRVNLNGWFLPFGINSFRPKYRRMCRVNGYRLLIQMTQFKVLCQWIIIFKRLNFFAINFSWHLSQILLFTYTWIKIVSKTRQYYSKQIRLHLTIVRVIDKRSLPHSNVCFPSILRIYCCSVSNFYVERFPLWFATGKETSWNSFCAKVYFYFTLHSYLWQRFLCEYIFYVKTLNFRSILLCVCVR